MKRLMITLVVVMIALATTNGCASTASVNRPFLLSAYVFSVDEDALPIMNKMETIQKEANDGKEVEEVYVMSL